MPGSYSPSSTSSIARSTRSLKMIRPTVVRMWLCSPRRRYSARSCRLTMPCSYESSASWADRNTCGRLPYFFSSHLPVATRCWSFSSSSGRGPARVLLDYLLEHVPDLGDHRVDHLLGGLDVLDRLALDEPGHDERLEQLEGHQLGQPALVDPQRGAGHDHRAARVVDALAE